MCKREATPANSQRVPNPRRICITNNDTIGRSIFAWNLCVALNNDIIAASRHRCQRARRSISDPGRGADCAAKRLADKARPERIVSIQGANRFERSRIGR